VISNSNEVCTYIEIAFLGEDFVQLTIDNGKEISKTIYRRCS